MVKVTAAFILSAVVYLTSAAPLERRINQDTIASKTAWEAACVGRLYVFCQHGYLYQSSFPRTRLVVERNATRLPLLLQELSSPPAVPVTSKTLAMP
jgi:hypothetical protein